MGLGSSLRSNCQSSEVDVSGVIDGLGDSLSNGSGSGLFVLGVPEFLLVLTSEEGVTVGVLQVAVGNVDDINDGPDTGSSESDALEDSEENVTEVVSVETDDTVRDGKLGGDPEVLGVHVSIGGKGIGLIATHGCCFLLSDGGGGIISDGDLILQHKLRLGSIITGGSLITYILSEGKGGKGGSEDELFGVHYILEYKLLSMN